MTLAFEIVVRQNLASLKNNYMEINNEDEYQNQIMRHYESIWEGKSNIYLWDKGNFQKLPNNFRVLEFPPNKKRDMWTYATCCMSQEKDESKVEVHVFSLVQDVSIIELLTALAFYHRNTALINLNHTLNFGRSWQNKSLCEFGFVSLPYLDGPILENLTLGSELQIAKFYWLIPITKEEVEYKKKYGSEALEDKFDSEGFNYLDSSRQSIVS
jgi:Suppressor of fused protein (SUFU)